MSPGFIARLGYYASLKCCMSGLCLMSEISVSCFLQGGNLLNLMVVIGNFRNIDDMVRACDSRHGLPQQFINKLEDLLKNCRIKTVHLGHTKKLKGFGPPANHPDCSFKQDDGSMITVADYYEQQCRTNPVYAAHLPQGRLRYPLLSLVQVGSKKKAIYIPAELVNVVPGQARQRTAPLEITSQLIKYAALQPNDRFQALSTESARNGLFHELQVDVNTTAFGFSGISSTPMKVQGFILPPAKLQYGNRVVEPELTGSWNLAGNVTFAHPPPSAPACAKGSSTSASYREFKGSSKQSYLYGLVIVYAPGNSEPRNFDNLVQPFLSKLEGDSRSTGIPLTPCFLGNSRCPYVVVEGKRGFLQDVMRRFKDEDCRIVITLLYNDVYSLVKLAADAFCLPTQCIRWQNLSRPPKNYHTSLLVKMNMKMGGVNHTLASRLPAGEIHSEKMDVEDNEPTFQFPPKSISWLFDEPCMVMVSFCSSFWLLLNNLILEFDDARVSM